jgi:hypothetical protein
MILFYTYALIFSLTFALTQKLQKVKTANNLLQNYTFKNPAKYKTWRNKRYCFYFPFILRYLGIACTRPLLFLKVCFAA